MKQLIDKDALVAEIKSLKHTTLQKLMGKVVGIYQILSGD